MGLKISTRHSIGELSRQTRMRPHGETGSVRSFPALLLQFLRVARRALQSAQVFGSTRTHGWLKDQLPRLDAKRKLDEEMIFSGLVLIVTKVAHESPEFESDEVFLEVGAYHLAEVKCFGRVHYGSRGEDLATKLTSRFCRLMSATLERDMKPTITDRISEYLGSIDSDDDPRDRIARLASHVSNVQGRSSPDASNEPPVLMGNLPGFSKLTAWSLSFSKVTFNAIDQLMKSES